jgi:hypothetical protein
MSETKTLGASGGDVWVEELVALGVWERLDFSLTTCVSLEFCSTFLLPIQKETKTPES